MSRDIFRYRMLLGEAKNFQNESNRLVKKYGAAMESIDLDGDTQFVMLSCINDRLPCGGRNNCSPYLEWYLRNGIKRALSGGGKLVLDDDLFRKLAVYDELKKGGKLSSVGISSNIDSYDYDSFKEIMSNISKSSKTFSSLYRKMKSLGDAVDEVYSGEGASVYALKTWEANRLLGSNTAWCTVGGYNHYVGYGGLLYIICHVDEGGVPILDEDRVQLHFMRNAHGDEMLYAMDVYDESLDIADIHYRFGGDVAGFVKDLAGSYFTERERVDFDNSTMYALRHYNKCFESVLGIGMKEFLGEVFGCEVEFSRFNDDISLGDELDASVVFDAGGRLVTVCFDEYGCISFDFSDVSFNKNSFESEFNGDVGLVIDAVRNDM